MTDKHISNAHKAIGKINSKYGNIKFYELPKHAQNRINHIHNVIFCVEMINSVLAYAPQDILAVALKDPDKAIEWELTRPISYLGKYITSLGYDTVKRIMKIQANSILRVDKAVHTDSEGLSYNSIIWKGEN